MEIFLISMMDLFLGPQYRLWLFLSRTHPLLTPLHRTLCIQKPTCSCYGFPPLIFFADPPGAGAAKSTLAPHTSTNLIPSSLIFFCFFVFYFVSFFPAVTSCRRWGMRALIISPTKSSYCDSGPQLYCTRNMSWKKRICFDPLAINITLSLYLPPPPPTRRKNSGFSAHFFATAGKRN